MNPDAIQKSTMTKSISQCFNRVKFQASRNRRWIKTIKLFFKVLLVVVIKRFRLSRFQLCKSITRLKLMYLGQLKASFSILKKKNQFQILKISVKQEYCHGDFGYTANYSNNRACSILCCIEVNHVAKKKDIGFINSVKRQCPASHWHNHESRQHCDSMTVLVSRLWSLDLLQSKLYAGEHFSKHRTSRK